NEIEPMASDFRGNMGGNPTAERSIVMILFCLALVARVAPAQVLPLPDRATDAPVGSEFVRRITSLEFTNREQEIFAQVIAGNVPDFLRKFCPVSVMNVIAGKTNLATFYT